MLELLTDYEVWASLLTLTALEIVLGIDNLIFLSIVSGRLPKHQQRSRARSAWPWRCSAGSRCCSRSPGSSGSPRRCLDVSASPSPGATWC